MLDWLPIVIAIASGVVAVIAAVNSTKSRKAAERADLRAREPVFEVSSETREGADDWKGSFGLALTGPADVDRVTVEIVAEDVRFEDTESARLATFENVRVGETFRISVSWDDGAVSRTGGTITFRIRSSLRKNHWGPRQVRVTLPDPPRSRRVLA